MRYEIISLSSSSNILAPLPLAPSPRQRTRGTTMIAPPPPFVHYAQMGKKEEGRKVGVTHVRVLQAEGGRRLHLHGACQSEQGARRLFDLSVVQSCWPDHRALRKMIYSTVCSRPKQSQSQSSAATALRAEIRGVLQVVAAATAKSSSG